LTAIVLATSLAWAWLVYRSAQAITGLSNMPVVEQSNVPQSLSVILTACDEAHTIEPALRSLRAQSHPSFEIIAVNDRSTDGTGEILDRIAAADERVRVLHIEDLPGGWLGKVHAMDQGAKIATSEWLLFSDADVIFAPDTLADAVRYAEEQQLDHLSLLPEMITRSALLEAATIAFAQILFHIIGVGTAKPHPLGVGAFNLVRRSTLERSAGIEWIKMEIADDTGLALLISNAGGKTQFHLAPDRLTLEWYPSVFALIKGLEKNAFMMAGNGQTFRMVAIFGLVGTLLLAPVLGLFLGPNILAQCAGGAAILSNILATAWMRLRIGVAPWGAVLAPLGTLIVAISAIWSTIRCVQRGGVNWRGTHYPLQALKDGKRVWL
jgi:hypothetical protein